MKPRTPPWHHATWAPDDIYAIKALSKGEATPDQQIRAMAWIVQDVSGLKEEPFRSDGEGGDRDTAFALGRLYVARQIERAATMPNQLIAEVTKQMRAKNG